MRKKRILFAVLVVTLLLTLLTGCAKDAEKESPMPTARVDEDGTTLLSEVDNTDEANFQIAYRRNGVSLRESEQMGIDVDDCVRFGDDYLIRCKIYTGALFTGNREDGNVITPNLVKINSVGETVADFSDACTLPGGYSLSKIGGNGEKVYLYYNQGAYEGDHIIARLEPDGSVTELFHPEGLDLDHFIYNILGTEDGIYLFEIIRDDITKASSIMIMHYDAEGNFVNSAVPDDSCNYSFAFDNSIYLHAQSSDGSQDTVIYQLEPDSLALIQKARFDSGRLINIDENALYIMDGTSLFRYDLETCESMPLLNTASFGLRYLDWIIPLTGGDFLCWDNNEMELCFLRQELTTGTDSRTQIVLGTLNQIRSYEQAVLTFNRVQTEYKIVIRDYSKYPDPIQILNTELLAGSGPDILDVSELSADILRSGMLVDLLPYLEEDPEIDTSDFFPAVFECLKTDGQLLTAVPTYMIYSFVTREDNYPDGLDGLDEFIAAASEEGDYYRYLIGREEFLQTAFCSDTFESYTETDIANILRFSEALLTEADREELEKVSFLQKDFADRQQRLIDEGKQKMFLRKFGGTDSVIIEELALEKPLKPLGLPFAPKNTGLIIPAIELGITASSDVKEGAWQFIRELYLPSYQKQLGVMQYPISKSAYDATEQGRYDLWATGYSVTVLFGDRMEERMVYEPMGLSSAREVLTAPYGVYHRNDAVMSLVNSAAEEYYTGKTTAEDAAHVILSKLKIYFSERE